MIARYLKIYMSYYTCSFSKYEKFGDRSQINELKTLLPGRVGVHFYQTAHCRNNSQFWWLEMNITYMIATKDFGV